MTAIGQMAAYLAAVRLEEVNEKVLSAVRYCLLDALGCGLLGSIMPEGHQIIAALADFNQEEGSPVWGIAYNLSPDNAAFVCGSFCHMRELDDVHYSIVHPGAVCVPASFAVAHHKQLTLADLLLAILCGIEAMVRIAKGINYLEHRQRGWHATATCGSFGAAAAAGKLLALDVEQMTNALGLAGSRTGGTWAFSADGAMSKRLHPGLAARDGVLSAYLAAVGVTGPSYILEAEDGGFYNATSAHWDINQVIKKGGDLWAIEEMEYKWYASCKSVHSPLEAARQIHDAHPHKKAEDITKVLLDVNHSSLAMAGKMYDPKSVISAQLSIPYGVALGLLGRTGGVEDYSSSCLEDPRVYGLAAKVQMQPSDELDRLRTKEHKSGAKITVFWQDGTMAQCEVDSPKGSLGQPLGGEDLKNKFITLASRALGKEQACQLKDIILKAPGCLPVREISKLLKMKKRYSK